VLYKQADGKQQFEDSDKTPYVKNGRDKWSVTKFAEVFFLFLCCQCAERCNMLQQTPNVTSGRDKWSVTKFAEVVSFLVYM